MGIEDPVIDVGTVRHTQRQRGGFGLRRGQTFTPVGKSQCGT